MDILNVNKINSPDNVVLVDDIIGFQNKINDEHYDILIDLVSKLGLRYAKNNLLVHYKKNKDKIYWYKIFLDQHRSIIYTQKGYNSAVGIADKDLLLFHDGKHYRVLARRNKERWELEKLDDVGSDKKRGGYRENVELLKNSSLDRGLVELLKSIFPDIEFKIKYRNVSVDNDIRYARIYGGEENFIYFNQNAVTNKLRFFVKLNSNLVKSVKEMGVVGEYLLEYDGKLGGEDVYKVFAYKKNNGKWEMR